jgi:hypothetical protein
MTKGPTMCAPSGKMRNTVVAAAIPEANSNVAAPPSSAVMTACGWS